ncbi:hypothetical protein [Solimonas soli]|uniref:hypothetical protein n=1 Tax=Solimonas soli TaxID=413479 RepID=UPI000483EC93|nr:hypothetical protein [Solimonas soli]
MQAGTKGPLVGDKPVSWHGATIKPGDAEAQVRKATGRLSEQRAAAPIGDRTPVGESWTDPGDKDDPRVLRIEFTRGRVSRVCGPSRSINP